jgi:hypothetical protein
VHAAGKIAARICPPALSDHELTRRSDVKVPLSVTQKLRRRRMMTVEEYDDERSGSFESLKDLPDDKVAVLGLVSTKFDKMEPPDHLVARIDEASRFFPRDRLALSTQCGLRLGRARQRDQRRRPREQAAPRRGGRGSSLGLKFRPLSPTSQARHHAGAVEDHCP